MTIGENILKFRKQKGMSQEELAEKLNVSRQSISLWETNQTVPQIDYLMELSKIFNVSLDELCGNEENIDCSLNESEIKENEELPLETTHFEFDEHKVNVLIKVLDKRNHRLITFFANLLLIGLGSIVIEDISSILVLLIFLNILFLVIFSIMNKNTKKLLLKEHRTIDVEFYDNYFISKIKSNTSRSETKINYNDISRVYVDDEFIVVVFNNKYTAVELSKLNENKDLIISKLTSIQKNLINRSSNVKDYYKLKTWSIILFVASLASIILALMSAALVGGLSKYSFANNRTFVLNTWVFFVIAIIPLSSLVFGIIFNNRFKCKKNIIAGIIMTAILVLYGSFCIIWRPFFSFDEKYLEDVAAETNINFPNEFLLVTETYSGSKETYVKFENENEVMKFETYIMSSDTWDYISNLPSNLDLAILFSIQSYDYFYIHEVENHGSSSFNERYIEKIVLAYDIDNNVLIICEVQSINEN